MNTSHQSASTNKSKLYHLIIFVSAGLILVIGGIWRGGHHEEQAGQSEVSALDSLRTELRDVYRELEKNELASIQKTLQSVTQKTLPSVVSVKSLQQIERPQLFSDFPSRGTEPVFLPPTSFSGVLIDQRGYILTSDNVTQIGEQFSIVFENGSRSTAQLVGVDYPGHLAVLKLQSTRSDMPVPKFARLHVLQAGTWLIKLGRSSVSQKNLSLAMIAGSVREPTGQETYLLDSAVIAEQEGGPAVNLDGEVIGIAIAHPVYQASASLVPIDYALNLAQKMIARSQVPDQSSIGVELQDLSASMQQYFGVEQGVLIANVKPDSPAQQSGLLQLDILTRLNDQPVKSAQHAIEVIRQLSPGTQLQLSIRRANRDQIINVEPQLPGSSPSVQPATTPEPETTEPVLHLELNQLSVTGEVQIQRVHSDVSAVQPGLLPGDIILSVNRTPVRTIPDFYRTQQKHPAAQPQLWQIKRGQQMFFLALREKVVIG